MIQITGSLSIPENEIQFTASTSSGPGGQHVNKVSTRITLLFDIQNSSVLSEEQKKRVSEKLATRINREGILRVSSQRHRSQSANRQQAIDRFTELVGEALQISVARKKSKIPARARKRRLANKRHRSLVKQRRTRIKSFSED